MDLSQFNANQKALLDQFRDAVQDCKLPDTSDVYLLRWLIAREYDLIRAEKMLRNSLEWRRKHRINTILEDFESPEVLKKYYPAGCVGRDKLFGPVYVVRYGMADLKGILLSVKKKEYLNHVICVVEESIKIVKVQPQRFRRSPDALVQSTIIFDLEGFSMRHITYKPAMETAIQLIQLYEANYPELLYRVFVVNAPKVFSIAYSMLKPFLHERTKNKIQIFSHDSKQWKAAILTTVDPEELPVAYGGTMTDPDGNPNCITKVNMGGEVPKSYYLIGGKSDINNKDYLTISHGAKEQLKFEVKKPASILSWEFHSEDSDIAFAIYRKQGNELIPIVPHDRVDCHLSPEIGEIDCDEAGVYIVEFDNSYSYVRSKKIWYSITVEPSTPVVKSNGNNILDHI